MYHLSSYKFSHVQPRTPSPVKRKMKLSYLLIIRRSHRIPIGILQLDNNHSVENIERVIDLHPV